MRQLDGAVRAERLDARAVARVRKKLEGACEGFGVPKLGEPRCKNLYSTPRTVSDYGAHRGHTNDRSVHAFVLARPYFGKIYG
jgi:hypothetical protein